MENNDQTKNSDAVIVASATKGRLTYLSGAAVFILIGLLAFISIKNISYPLLWSDESETIMTAQQIINYGYPKVHDGKNVVFIPDNSLLLGYKPTYDAYIAMTWGSFYYGAIGVWLAHFSNDIYLKTAIIRLPFAFAGLLGILFFAFAMRGFFRSVVYFRAFVAAFLILEMLSVNMLLHIREARYYPLVILLAACYFYIFISFHFHQKTSRARYLLVLSIILVVAFNTNFIVYTSMCAVTVLWHILLYIKYRFKVSGATIITIRETAILMSPVLLSAIIISPELVFFESFKTARLADLYYHNGVKPYTNHLIDIFTILFRYDLLPAMLAVKMLRIISGLAIKKTRLTLANNVQPLKRMSAFAFLFFIVYAFVTAKMPFLFTRYFIVLQPIVVLILLTDVLILLGYATLLPEIKLRFSRAFVLATASGICLVNVLLSTNHLSDYIYQISHPYKGPLDYYIPAIKARFPHPENIVLATNYEELSYEYYLGCKVILGYQNHFQSFDDSVLRKYSPDVIIIRPGWPQNNKPYQYYLQQANYQKISFPVKDWPVNNVADLYFYLNHRFKTQSTEVESEKACMYIKTTI